MAGTISDKTRDVATSNPHRETHSGMDLQSVVDSHINSLGNAINTGVGNAVGGAIEKAILGGKESTGTHKFSQTYQGRRRARMSGIKGIASDRQY